ncbi:MAG: ATP-binding cassette domain-containing protein [Lachnospiraceae bacterium]|nr:ATP-binding cassette domain-containing protein [Lachnospiraceae bacterium]
MIEITNLYKSFEDKVILKDFNATISAGEFVIFTGESGCGKTTLLNMIGAIEELDSGSIKIAGIDINQAKNRKKLFREVYGFIFQNFALVENKTVEENLSFILPKYSSGISIADALSQVGLLGYQKKEVYKLSGGEQQRVSLARLMLKRCRVILADEPTGSLDQRNADEVMNILSDFNKQGKTIVLVTHDEKIKNKYGRVIELSARL